MDGAAPLPASDAALLAAYDRPVPRYTSYPTAPQFHGGVDGAAYRGWLGTLADAGPMSLYLHVPFCDELCLYCGCNTAVVRREAPRRAYAARLMAEISLVAAAIGTRLEVASLHWGGGTPTALPGDCLEAVMRHVRSLFTVLPDAEIAMEIDPRHLADDRLAAMQAIGVTRASLGVQDFDATVQQAVGRVQPAVMVQDCVSRLRSIGVRGINFDLIYGLPHQTVAGVAETARLAAAMGPDRIAGFGYAHVPWMKRHQALLPADALPCPTARFAQRATMAAVLEAEGYVAIGLDHFARPDDALAQAAAAGRLQRSFQGYTADASAVVLGFGASAIGTLPQGYVQNHAGVPEWAAAIDTCRLATCRGVALSAEDRLRRAVIESIMCTGAVDLAAMAARHEADAAPLQEAALGLERFAADGLLHVESGRIRVTRAGQPFLRSVAAMFDAYRGQSPGRHASAV